MSDNKQIKNDAITRQEDDFAQWYTDVCRKAELMDYSSVKGFIIYRPYGYAIWEEIQNYLNKRFKEIQSPYFSYETCKSRLTDSGTKRGGDQLTPY